MRWMLPAFCLAVAASPAFAQPVPEPGEPPIVKSAGDGQGEVIYEQVFVAPRQKLEAAELSVAEKYRLFGPSGAIIPARTVLVRCGLLVQGRLQRQSCALRGDQFFDARTLVELNKFDVDSIVPGNVRPFIQTSGEGWEFNRYLNFEVEIPEIINLPLDLDSGPLVDHRQFKDLIAQEYARLSYPVRALREELTGRQTLECQVQSDTSVICRSIAFSEPKGHDIFAAATARFFSTVRISRTLEDGSDPRGVRFQVPINWMISN